MTGTMQVRPAEGRSVPDPQRGDLLPDAGRTVPRNAYWRRRVSAGDVVEVQGSGEGHPKAAAMQAAGRRPVKGAVQGTANAGGKPEEEA